MRATLKCLEGDLEKSIAAYNSSLSRNNGLKNEIAELRKDKKNQLESYRALTEKIEKTRAAIENS